MGHYASEMDPDWGASIERSAKRNELRDLVRDIPLSRFKASDLPMLNRLFTHNHCGLGDLHRGDADRLREIAGGGDSSNVQIGPEDYGPAGA